MTVKTKEGDMIVARLSFGNWMALIGMVLPILLGGFISWMDLRIALATLDTKITAHEKRLDNLEASRPFRSTANEHRVPDKDTSDHES